MEASHIYYSWSDKHLFLNEAADPVHLGLFFYLSMCLSVFAWLEKLWLINNIYVYKFKQKRF